MSSTLAPSPTRQDEFWNEPVAQICQSVDSSPDGLTSTEAERRLHTFGTNEIGRREHVVVREFVAFVLNPLVIILLFASLIASITGDRVSAAIILVIVCVSIAIDFWQSYRSQQAVNRLRAMVAVQATVLRDGHWTDIPQRQVVPGDVIRLSAGDLIPADARLIDAHDLFTNEATLTGESLPAEKSDRPASASQSLNDATCAVFLGTSVISGTATALVVHTGRATELGHIARSVARKPAETEFERGTRGFGLLIMRTVVVLVLFVFIVLVFIKHANPVESLLFAVALAVGLTPEGLPMITSVTLAQGAREMARKKVIVKRLASIENFGSMDILCSDKTGTLTEGRITLEKYCDAAGNTQDRVLLYAALNAAFETGIKSPLDDAIIQHQHPAISSFSKVDEIPYDFNRRRSSIVVAGDNGQYLVTKGAPESVLPRCTQVEVKSVAQPLSSALQAGADATYETLSKDGFRVLAIAYRPVDRRAAYQVSDESTLILVGFAAFLDPPRADARDTLTAMARDHITVKIMTGDNDLVTEAVCRQVGLDGGNIVLGSQLDATSDEALGPLAERTAVFARVSPEQKNRVIRALQKRGHAVGFMGDGINDAPSLHDADVGISVEGAVDVAKDAADIILLERSLNVLHDGVIAGRRCFGNIMKYIMMGTSSNFGNMFSMAGASVFLPFLPMLPTQILLNNLIYDASQLTIPTDNVDDSYLQNPKHWNIKLIRRFMITVGPISSIYDFLTFGALIWIFHSSEKLFHTGWFIESLCTQTLVILIIRTAGPAWKSRPSKPLIASVLAACAVACILPFTPLGPLLGFVIPPAPFFLFLIVVVITYLALVEVVKLQFFRRNPT